MFNIFSRNKRKLSELIPNNFVDIHSHILPGIDDGAKSVKESNELILKMKKLGFSKIIGTPHTYSGLYNNTNESIRNSFYQLKKNLKSKIEVSYASEYLIESSLIEKAENKSLLTVKDNLVLVEMSYMHPPENINDILFHIILNDYIPILAHPERYNFYQNIKKFYDLKDRGCLFQLNLLSTTGYYGGESIKKCDEFLKNNLIDFLGSDIHNNTHIDAFENNLKINEISTLERIFEDSVNT